jgi:hypothetical protein
MTRRFLVLLVVLSLAATAAMATGSTEQPGAAPKAATPAAKGESPMLAKLVA